MPPELLGGADGSAPIPPAPPALLSAPLLVEGEGVKGPFPGAPAAPDPQGLAAPPALGAICTPPPPPPPE